MIISKRGGNSKTSPATPTSYSNSKLASLCKSTSTWPIAQRLAAVIPADRRHINLTQPQRRTIISHIVTIKSEVRDRAAIDAACQRLKLPQPEEGTCKLFKSEATGTAVRLPEWRYPVVCNTAAGELSYDDYGGKWGERVHLDRFLQAYACERAKVEGWQLAHWDIAGGLRVPGTDIDAGSADAMSPCILFADELEKLLSGAAGSGQTDSGVSARLFGTMLLWMNDHTSDFYLIATCNDIPKLPPEFARAERFDAVVFLDLPGREEKDAIWQMY